MLFNNVSLLIQVTKMSSSSFVFKPVYTVTPATMMKYTISS